MVVGLGSGSTAEIFITLLAQAVAAGMDITGCATSRRSQQLASRLGISVKDPATVKQIDLCVDGNDEVDSQLRMIKGGGGCLLREKIIAAQADCMVTICDASKMVAVLGKFPLAVEVIPFAYPYTCQQVATSLQQLCPQFAGQKLRCNRQNRQFVVTDNYNYLLDCQCQAIANPATVSAALANIPGVVEHGLFLTEADILIAGNADGSSKIIYRQSGGQ